MAVHRVIPFLANGTDGEWNASIVNGAPAVIGGAAPATQATLALIKTAIDEIKTNSDSIVTLQTSADNLLTSIDAAVAASATEATAVLIKNLLTSIDTKSSELANIKNAIDLAKVVADNQLTKLTNIEALINGFSSVNAFRGVYNNTEGIFEIKYDVAGEIVKYVFTDMTGAVTDPANLTLLADPALNFAQILGKAKDTPFNILLPFSSYNLEFENLSATDWIKFQLTCSSGNYIYYCPPLKKMTFIDEVGKKDMVLSVDGICTVINPITALASDSSIESNSVVPATSASDAAFVMTILNN